jgi:alpha-mannosidase
VLALRFDADGVIVSCRAAAGDGEGAEHAGAGLNRLVVHRDPYVWPFNAWDIKGDYFEKTPVTLRVTSSESYLDGATVVRLQRLTGPRVTIVQRIILEAGSDVVRFDTEVEWHQKHHMLRAEFRPAHYGPTVKCEIQFGHIERVTTERDSVEKAQFEVCAHKWIATEDATGGFALLNDSKYGHRAKNGLISLNLLRSPTYPDKTADRGSHRFSYAFTPFATGDLAKVVREGYRLNNPLQLTAVALGSVASVDDPAIVIETIKPAEAGAGTVLRLYESLGRETTAALRTTLAHRAAHETDLLERRLAPADLGRLHFGRFEIKTILLEG